MARADFYILSGNATASRFTCSITGKAWSQGNTVFIMARDSAEAGILDDLLWTFHDISFLPHEKISDGDTESPVIIGWPGEAIPSKDLIINLTDTIPDCVKEFERVIEIIPEDDEQRKRGRERYRDYRGRGYEMHNHEIGSDRNA